MNKDCMIFKIGPEKFDELTQIFLVNKNSVTFLTEVKNMSEVIGAIFLKKTELEVKLEEFEQTYREK
ncbi:hypothetical protein [Pedobacter jamesrossensis]|uniref:Uncharacterized protein n=1 Tax=Pedobacter jamesrossensis TaxID=1908238 RepID=A0ABV8NR25_9SPHI